jgi:hypothetical protein
MPNPSNAKLNKSYTIYTKSLKHEKSMEEENVRREWGF